MEDLREEMNAIISACESIVQPYRLKWDEHREKVIPDMQSPQPYTMYLMWLLEAMNRVLNIFQEEWGAVNLSPHHLSLINDGLPDMVVAVLLNGDAVTDEMLRFLRTIKRASTFRYENQHASIGFIFSPATPPNEMQSRLRERRMSFVQLDEPVPFTDSLLESSKQSYVVPDGRVMAYVLDAHANVLGIAHKQETSHEITHEIFSLAERQNDRTLIHYGLLESFRVWAMQQDSFLRDMYSQVATSNESLEAQILQNMPRFIFGVAHDGNVQLDLGPRTSLRWSGGGWGFRDGALMQAQVTDLLLGSEAAASNFLPDTELMSQTIEGTKLVDYFVRTFENESDANDVERLLVTMQERFDSDPEYRERMRLWSKLSHQKSANVPEGKTSVPERLVPYIMWAASLGAEPSTDEGANLGNVLGVAERLCDAVLDLSETHVGSIIGVVRPENIDAVKRQCHSVTFPLHRYFLGQGDEFSLMTIDKYYFRKIASIDGAVLVSTRGTIKEFGLMANISHAGGNADSKEKLEGARTLAAKSLSGLQEVSFVLKVSEDGPITLFENGTMIELPFR